MFSFFGDTNNVRCRIDLLLSKHFGYLTDQVYSKVYLRISRTINNRSANDIKVPHDMIIIRFKSLTSSGA